MSLKGVVRKSGLSDDTMRGVIAIVLLVGWLTCVLVGRVFPPELQAVASVYFGYYIARRLNGDGVRIRKG
jgi:hypothetical protein